MEEVQTKTGRDVSYFRAGGPQTLFTGKLLLTHRENDWTRKKGKKRKIERKRRKIWKWKGKEVKILEIGGKMYENEQRAEYRVFFFCFVLFFLLLLLFVSLLETTKICLGSTKMVNFYRGKLYFTPGKSGKLTLPPIKKVLLRPWQDPSMQLW